MTRSLLSYSRRCNRPSPRSYPLRLAGVRKTAAAQGLLVEKVRDGGVFHYAVFRQGSLNHALHALWYRRLRDVESALRPAG